MADGLQELIPSARVGHIGLYRDENHRPIEYLVRLPEVDGRIFILCDPMIGTGYSAAHAVQVLKRRGVPAKDILFLALVASPEGITGFQGQHPDAPMSGPPLPAHLDQPPT